MSCQKNAIHCFPIKHTFMIEILLTWVSLQVLEELNMAPEDGIMMDEYEEYGRLILLHSPDIQSVII